MFKIRPASGGGSSSSSGKIDIRGYGSSDWNKSSNDAWEKSSKIRKSNRGLQVKYLPLVLGMMVLFIIASMRQAKVNSSNVIQDVQNNHAFGLKMETNTSTKTETTKQEETKLAEKVAALSTTVRQYKPPTGSFMETDPTAVKMTRELQEWTQKLILARYGDHSFRVVLELEFPPSIPDYDQGKAGRVVFEMAPVQLIPCSVFYFLEIARTFQKGNFIRNADHVLQASVVSKVRQEMPFQEYSPEHPHAKGTTGYAGRPSGPQFYISTMDNTKNHGPGSQQKANPHEADANFGRVVEGMDDVVPRIHSVPQKEFLDKENFVKISTMTILYGDKNTDGSMSSAAVHWKEWYPSTSTINEA